VDAPYNCKIGGHVSGLGRRTHRDPGANSFSRDRDQDLERHPTSKPWRLVADCFAGGGTIIVPCEKTRRRAAAIEIDPIYCDLSIERWEKPTGKEAVLEDSGETFAALRSARMIARLKFPSPLMT
jgi:hypothetical protein